MPSSFLQITLPLPLWTKVSRAARKEGQALNAFVVQALERGLEPGGPELPVAVMASGGAARDAKSRNISVVMRQVLKERLIKRAEMAGATQAAVVRAILQDAVGHKPSSEAGRLAAMLAVQIPALATDRPDSVQGALHAIKTQLARSARPAVEAFAHDSERERHERQLALLATLTAALFGHRVALSEAEVTTMLTEWGPEETALIASVIGAPNLLEILARIAHEHR